MSLEFVYVSLGVQYKTFIFFNLHDFANFYSDQSSEEQIYFMQESKWPGGQLSWNNQWKMT